MFRHVELKPSSGMQATQTHTARGHKLARSGSQCVISLRELYDKETVLCYILIQGAAFVRADSLWT